MTIIILNEVQVSLQYTYDLRLDISMFIALLVCKHELTFNVVVSDFDIIII